MGLKRIAAILFMVALILSGCSGRDTDKLSLPEQTGAAAGKNNSSYQPPVFKAVVKPYKVKEDLGNLENASVFGSFTVEQKSMLARNGFLVTPGKSKQIFYVYEHNEYYNLPSFITTDSILHTYHIYYDSTLRRLEKEKFLPLLKDLGLLMVERSLEQYNSARNKEIKEAGRLNTAFFAVAAKLLDDQAPVPASVKAEVEKELLLIRQHAGRSKSALFPFMMDYSQFIPRGHYTRDGEFEKYFKCMMWYGLAPFPLEIEREDGVTARADRQIIQAQLFTAALHQNDKGENSPTDLWEKIYAARGFYVGKSDDHTPAECLGLMRQVYGNSFNIDDFADSGKLNEFYELAKELPGPDIRQQLVGIPSGPQFRFFGQSYIPDSEMLQKLTSWPERAVPRGLDVMAVLGSARAREILLKTYKEEEKWPQYTQKLNDLEKKFSSLEQDRWHSDMYHGWLWSLQPLLAGKNTGYPSFMTNEAWQDKSINTALGSWAQLRHDTILYGKQSGAECGGDEPPPVPAGYVEPEVEFYHRLGWLTGYSRDQLAARGLLSREKTESFDRLQELIYFLRDVSVKELAGTPLTAEEYERIRYYGAELEAITISTFDGDYARWIEITSETDKNMASVADVHTFSDQCLEEGVGHANEIFVAVPVDGKLYLARGAVYSYYEFTQPASGRLTDEAWQKMLQENRAPAPPVWTDSFLSDARHVVPRPDKVYEYTRGFNTGAALYEQ